MYEVRFQERVYQVCPEGSEGIGPDLIALISNRTWRQRMKTASIPSLVPRKYHHEIKCILQETAEITWRNALGVIKNDDDYLRVANINGAMKSAPDGVLAMIAK